jgi:uncharacterized protein
MKIVKFNMMAAFYFAINFLTFKQRISYLTAELVGLFIVAPLIFSLVQVNPVLVLPGLFAFTAISFTILKNDKKFTREYEFSFIKLRLFLPGFSVIALLLTLTAGIYLYYYEPQNLLKIPSEHPRIWILIIFIYPIFSALPQEFIYRRFFFHRYSALFNEKDKIIFSAITFGLLHIIFHHWQSVILSAAGGYLFARTYSQSRSLIITAMEHSIYGIIIFTIGLHQYFYDGPLLH